MELGHTALQNKIVYTADFAGYFIKGGLQESHGNSTWVMENIYQNE